MSIPALPYTSILRSSPQVVTAPTKGGQMRSHGDAYVIAQDLGRQIGAVRPHKRVKLRMNLELPDGVKMRDPMLAVKDSDSRYRGIGKSQALHVTGPRLSHRRLDASVLYRRMGRHRGFVEAAGHEFEAPRGHVRGLRRTAPSTSALRQPSCRRRGSRK